MNESKRKFYLLTFSAYLCVVGTYYWAIKYFIETANLQRDEFITGFMMVGSLSSPIWVGCAIVALIHFKKMKQKDFVFSFLPSLLILAAFSAIWLSRQT